MIRAILSSLAIVASVAFVGQAYAYTGVSQDPRFGEHPYQVRRIEENKREKFVEEYLRYGRYLPKDYYYYHPSRASRSVLHPYYRRGGRSVGDNYAEWHGYLPLGVQNSSQTDVHCLNFTSAWNSYYDAAPVYDCY